MGFHCGCRFFALAVGIGPQANYSLARGLDWDASNPTFALLEVVSRFAVFKLIETLLVRVLDDS